VRLAEDAWNTRDPEKVPPAYTIDSVWRNRAEFLSGREAIIRFLKRKWARELDYRLIKKLWAFHRSRIAVRLPTSGTMTAEIGSAPTETRNWEFDGNGLMTRRLASINDLPIKDTDREYFWPLGRRPDYHPGLSELDL
jgi:nuclear transport factor 2 (NTF2) superfamily protein